MPKVKKELTQEEQELFNELKKLSKRANQRIVRLEREFGKDTWATKYLKEKLANEPLQAWTVSGRVKVNKSMTVTQMQATIKFTKGFLNSSISTKRGIKKAKQKAIKTLKTRFSTDVSEITYEESEALYNLFEDKEVNSVTNYLKGSTVLDIVEEFRERVKKNFSDFYSAMKAHQQYNKGKEIVKLREIYLKYIYKGNKNKNDIDILYSDLEGDISASNINDLDEIENYINDLYNESIINEKEYNYLINLVNEKRGKIL